MNQASRSPEANLRRAVLAAFKKETTTMREVQRDIHGRTRVEQIDMADRLLEEARLMAAAWTADPERGFVDFADEDCDICSSPRMCGLKKYEELLTDAAAGYFNTGLRTLADRVDAIRYSAPSKAWTEFDEQNLGDEL